MFKLIGKLIRMLMAWFTEKRIDYHWKKEDYHKYKRLMIAENDSATHEELREFLDQFQSSDINYMFLWQKIGILASTVIVEMTLAVLVACGVFSIQPRPNLDPTLVLLVAAGVIAVTLDIFVICYLMDKIDISIYYHRMKKMEAKLAIEPTC